MMLVALSVAAAGGPTTCAQPLPAQQIDALVDRALVAYADGDARQFEASLRESEANLPCVIDVIDATTASNLHLAEALLHRQSGLDDASAYRDAWVRGHGASFPSPTLLAIARRDPEFVSLLPPESAPMLSPDARPRLPPSLGGGLTVNGRVNAVTVPSGEPYVFQIARRSGGVSATVYVRPGEPLPAYPRLRPVLTAVALGGAALSAAGLLTATATHDQLFGEDWVNREPRDLLELQTLNHAAVATGIGAGVIGLGAAAGLGWSFR